MLEGPITSADRARPECWELPSRVLVEPATHECLEGNKRVLGGPVTSAGMARHECWEGPLRVLGEHVTSGGRARHEFR